MIVAALRPAVAFSMSDGVVAVVANADGWKFFALGDYAGSGDAHIAVALFAVAGLVYFISHSLVLSRNIRLLFPPAF